MCVGDLPCWYPWQPERVVAAIPPPPPKKNLYAALTGARYQLVLWGVYIMSQLFMDRVRCDCCFHIGVLSVYGVCVNSAPVRLTDNRDWLPIFLTSMCYSRSLKAYPYLRM